MAAEAKTDKKAIGSHEHTFEVEDLNIYRGYGVMKLNQP
jgi:hypothetical protein